MGVCEYTTLPKEYENLLPTAEQFQHLIDTLDLKKEQGLKS
jgi:hypothetical protein